MSNKKSDTKLSAFTLPELLIVMIVSAIVISLIYTVFIYAGKVWTIFHANQQKIMELSILNSAIEEDVESSNYIISEESHKLSFIYNNDTVCYMIDSCILRTHGNATDTFHIKTKNLKFTYLDEIKNMKVIGSIKFDVVSPTTFSGIAFRKHYCSSDLIDL